MYKLRVIYIFFCWVLFTSYVNATDFNNCRPFINNTLPQFIIGYGSLMQEASKRQNAPIGVGDNYPIYISGFKRGWIEPGLRLGIGTTYLGVIQDVKSKINAVYFELNDPSVLKEYDEREKLYCRALVPVKNIKALSAEPLPRGQYWIYVTHRKNKHLPTHQHPILQRYVDIFLSGCLQVEEKYHLQHFANDCVKRTSYWSKEWVNDRVNPREKTFLKIDKLIAK